MPEFIQEVNKVSLFERLRFEVHADSLGYINGALIRHKYCYLASIDLHDFRDLIINASVEARNDSLPRAQMPTIAEMIVHIKKNDQILSSQDKHAALNPKRLRELLDDGEGQPPTDCFIQDKFPKMRNKYYVIDGMHRLLAYGLSANLEDLDFPLQLYLCTNSPKENISLS